MNKQRNSPGIYVPVPVFYIVFFYFSLLIQYEFPLFGNKIFRREASHIVGWLLMIAGFAHILAAWYQFIRTNNSVATTKPANNLQTGGVYAFSRNPMYIGFFFMYFGAAAVWGNWWTFILSPFLILIIDQYVAGREEKYLHEKFGQDYTAYKEAVRKWL